MVVYLLFSVVVGQGSGSVLKVGLSQGSSSVSCAFLS